MHHPQSFLLDYPERAGMSWPQAGWFALILPLVSPPAAPSGDASRFESVVLRGKVVKLATVLKASGLDFDEEPVAKQVVLQGDDGTSTALISDEASRALFLDDRLRDRPAEIVARRYPGLAYLQVVSFRVDEEGQLRTPEYFCEICTISVRYPQICPCCQGPMVLRMKPESR
jgi:hypothetical protein